MPRRLLNLLTVLSLVLSVAAIGLWLRSHASEVILVDSQAGRLLLIGLDAPRARAQAAREAYTIEAFLRLLLSPPVIQGRPPPVRPAEHRLLGFWYVRGEKGRIAYPAPAGGYHGLNCPFWIVGMPYWFVVALTAAPPAAWLWRRRRAVRRRRSNACTRCGYDLRATPGRCPECGTMAPAKTP